jgi:HD-GYP domain-containing protein (c-di-GMP phosphodiesterase class II)
MGLTYNIFGFLLFASGAGVLILAAFEYHKLLNYYRQEVYESLGKGYYVNLILLYMFIFGFTIASVDILLREVGIFHIFIALAFLLAAVYVLFSVRAQAHAAVLLREKVLEAIRAFVYSIDAKDNSFKNHSKHVYDIVDLFYKELPDYEHVLNREKLLDAAILHDIGKINISAEVLCKQDQLTAEEWELVKSHAKKGKEMLDETCFSEISDWVMYHHERVDGNGYYRLVSEDIPLESKIIAVADVYSALCSDRAWRPRKNHEEAVRVLKEGAGTQFDSKLVACFLRIDPKALEEATARAHPYTGNGDNQAH